MKELLTFSLKRRFLSKTTIILNIIFFVLIGSFFFSDKIIDAFSQKNTLKIYHNYSNEVISLLDLEMLTVDFDNAEIKEDDLKEHEVILGFDNNYKVKSLSSLSIKEKAQITAVILQLSYIELQQNATSEEIEKITTSLNPTIEFHTFDNQEIIPTDKQNIVTIIVTSIYFMMLGFSSIVANEVVYEKNSRVIEFILTSVTVKQHFLSKVLIGFFNISVQTVLGLLILLFWLIVRSIFDNGYGLIQAFNSLGILKTTGDSFVDIINQLQIDASMIYHLTISLVFVIVGLLIIQTILVIISSFISNIEESSSIQGPMYVLLLIIYYLSIFLNSPQQLNSGIAYYLSYIPIFSMLFIPSRLLSVQTSITSIFLSLTISLLFIFILVKFGVIAYRYGILGLNKNKKIK